MFKNLFRFNSEPVLYFKNLILTHASVYAKFRPKPPKELINTVLNYLGERLSPEDWRSSVDVGCGSGQATKPLAKHFTHVYGFDPSSAQIQEAIRLNDFNNISFKVCSAEELPIETNSVQLLTACQSVHWFDLKNFFKEVDRVLCPNGVLALFGYRMPDVSHTDFPNDERVKNLCLKFYKNESLLWSKKERQLVDEGLASITLPYDNSVRKDKFETIITASANELKGYVLSWSAFNTLNKQNEETAQKFLNSFDDEIKNIFGNKNFDEIQLKIHFNYFLLMATK